MKVDLEPKLDLIWVIIEQMNVGQRFKGSSKKNGSTGVVSDKQASGDQPDQIGTLSLTTYTSGHRSQKECIIAYWGGKALAPDAG